MPPGVTACKLHQRGLVIFFSLRDTLRGRQLARVNEKERISPPRASSEITRNMQVQEEVPAINEDPLLPCSTCSLALWASPCSDPCRLPGTAELFSTLRAEVMNLLARDLCRFFDEAPTQSLFFERLEPSVISMPQQQTEPMMVLAAGDVNSPSHGPRTHKQTVFKSLINLRNRRGTKAKIESPRNRGRLLCLESKKRAHSITRVLSCSGFDEAMADDTCEASLGGCVHRRSRTNANRDRRNHASRRSPRSGSQSRDPRQAYGPVW